MSNPFIGQIAAFGFSFPPRGWMLCQGQLLSVNQYQALFSLLGTFYGGNGSTTFALPDLRGRAGVSFGQGTGLSNYAMGTQTGTENVTLSITQIPQHNHFWTATTAVGDQPSPSGGLLAGGQIPNGTPIPSYAAPGGAVVPLAPSTLASVGSNTPHNNMQPFLVMNYSIAVQGLYPSRN